MTDRVGTGSRVAAAMTADSTRWTSSGQRPSSHSVCASRLTGTASYVSITLVSGVSHQLNVSGE